MKPGDRDEPPGAQETSGHVRPLAERDVPQVVNLYGRIFRKRGIHDPAAAGEYLHEVLCRNPWRDDALPSLVYEDDGGRIAGCLGVMPRKMHFEGRPIEAAISHTFMVEPGSRSSLAALALARTFLSGGQDLSIAEGGTPSSRILERFGGSTSLLLSLRWTRPLRPSRYLLSFLSRRGLAAPVSWAIPPLCAAADALAPVILGAPALLARPRLTGEDLGTDDLLECLSRVTAERSLRPAYDRESLNWLLNLLARKRDRGLFQRVAVRDAAGDVLGWYLFYLNRGGVNAGGQNGGREAFVGGGPRPPLPPPRGGGGGPGIGTVGPA